MEATERAASLTIADVSGADCGVYAARVENRAGVAACSANVLLDAPATSAAAPTFEQTLQPVTATAGQLVRLDARVAGQAPVRVHWLRDGQPLEADMTHKLLQEQELHTLLILEATPLDRGLYECVAANAAGEARCQAPVDVRVADGARRRSSGAAALSPPSVLQPLHSVHVPEASPVSFHATVSGLKSKCPLTA